MLFRSRPEFLNRLDDILIFDTLKPEQIGDIVDIQFARLQGLVDPRGLVLHLSAPARDWLAERGYDPVYGARPLKRVIQQRIENPIATRILSGAYEEGDTIVVTVTGEQFVFDRRPAPEPPIQGDVEVVEPELVEE